MTQIQKQKWLSTGLMTLDKNGADHLKISDLCQQLNVTKGAFYHWFKSKKDFDFALLEYWRDTFTEQFILLSDSGSNSEEKLTLLIRQCIEGLNKDSRLEIEINMWSKQNVEVGEFVLEVYQQRFDYVMKLLLDIYPCAMEAKRHALLLYCLLIGCDLFFRKISKEEAELMFREYL
jgi:AcrR family transcriptional regulator